MNYNPADFYNNKGYQALQSKNHNPNAFNNMYQYYGSLNSYPKPRTSNYSTRQIDQKELSEARMALGSLKAKMGTAPRNIGNQIININSNSSNRRFMPTFDINSKLNNNNNSNKINYSQRNSNIPSYSSTNNNAYGLGNNYNNNNNNYSNFNGRGNRGPLINFSMNNNINNRNYNDIGGSVNTYSNNDYTNSNSNVNTNTYNNYNRSNSSSNKYNALSNSYNKFNQNSYNNHYNKYDNYNNYNSNNKNNYNYNYSNNNYNNNIYNNQNNFNNNSNNYYNNNQKSNNNYNNFSSSQNMNQDANDERPLDLGENLDKDKEKVNADEGEQTFPCPDCGRSFVRNVLEKHVKICKKVFQQKRKAFDSKKTRINDSEQAALMKKGEIIEKKNARLKMMQKKDEPKWKKQSEELRSIARGDCGNKAQIKSAIEDSYILCKFCNRKYNEEAYNKHLNGCERRFKDAQLRNKMGKGRGGNKRK